MNDTESTTSSSTHPASPPRGLWAPAGATAAVLSFIGVHVMHPPGAPEHMTDAQVVAWITPAATQIAAGGSLGLLACLLLLAFGQGWSAQLHAWGTPAWASQLAGTSITVTAATLGVGTLLQVIAGLSYLPSENTTQPSLAATLVNLYGGLTTSAWALLLPAVLAGFGARRAGPRWAVVVAALSTTTVALSVALPPIAWAPAGAWLITISIGRLVTSDARPRTHSNATV